MTDVMEKVKIGNQEAVKRMMKQCVPIRKQILIKTLRDLQECNAFLTPNALTSSDELIKKR